jgi:hypothetical protein
VSRPAARPTPQSTAVWGTPARSAASSPVSRGGSSIRQATGSSPRSTDPPAQFWPPRRSATRSASSRSQSGPGSTPVSARPPTARPSASRSRSAPGSRHSPAPVKCSCRGSRGGLRADSRIGANIISKASRSRGAPSPSRGRRLQPRGSGTRTRPRSCAPVRGHVPSATAAAEGDAVRGATSRSPVRRFVGWSRGRCK